MKGIYPEYLRALNNPIRIGCYQVVLVEAAYQAPCRYAGLLPFGDPDQAVPVGQLFFPPYLFKQDGSRATRPVIAKSPEEISYGGHFDITVAGNPDQVSSVVLLRSDHNTHSLTTGDRYVKLAFNQKGATRKREIRIRAPNCRLKPCLEFTCCSFWTKQEYPVLRTAFT